MMKLQRNSMIVASVIFVGDRASVSHAFMMPASSFKHQRQSFSPFIVKPKIPFMPLASTASSVSSNEDLLPGIAAIDSMNAEINQNLAVLRDQAYFKLYSIDMLASCEYLPQELFECYSETCEIYPVDEEEVRTKVHKFSKRAVDSAYN
mmetsp:Transcript_25080/g.35109  ORF Transcript_25080/g.35109 Transcript_25080/m.35109 type:complete len:149 (-) Transcript_25080:961-1407(-)